jgi:YD repeat-containing protein
MAGTFELDTDKVYSAPVAFVSAPGGFVARSPFAVIRGFLWILLVGALVVSGGRLAQAQPVFGDKGFQSNHIYSSQLPYEHIDHLTGNVLLTFTDLVLPGEGGFDLRIQRTYNSKIFANPASFPAGTLDERTWAGIGWTLHMGRVLNPGQYDLADPIIEMPDGGRHQAYPTVVPSCWCYITRDFWLYDKGRGILYLPNGVTYTFGQVGPGDAENSSAAYATQITDPFGNSVAIEYFGAPLSLDAISRITQTLASGQTRQVTFTVAPMGGNTGWLQSMTYAGRTWAYQLTPVTAWTFAELTSVTPPVGPAWTFAYSPNYEMSSVTTPNGGTISYQFSDQTFFIGTDVPYYTRVLSRRTTGGRDITPGVWTYAYAQGTGYNQTIVTGPCETTTYDFIGVGRYAYVGNVWSIGLASRRAVSSGGQTLETEDSTWVPSAPIADVGEDIGANQDSYIYVPMLQRRVVTRGSATFTTVNSYNTTSFSDYARPYQTVETGNRGDVRTTTRQFQYGFTPYIFDKIQSETVTVGLESFTTSYGYDLATGFKTSDTRFGITTTLTSTAGGDVASRTDANNHTTSFTYTWGMVSSIHTPQYTITRQVNTDGTIASETRRGFTTNFAYDAMMRPTTVTPPLGAAKTTSYDNNAGTWVSIARGGGFVTTYLDGFGRPSATLDAVGVKTDRQYDACGNLAFESYPYTTDDIGTTYTYDGLGRITRKSNPDNPVSYSTLAYDGVDVTVTDEESRVTKQEFSGFGDPGSCRLTAVVDAMQTRTTYAYNAVDSLKTVTQPGTNARQWIYNSKNQLTSEAHPENGTVTYSYDAAGNLTQRTDARGQIGQLAYDGNNRLISVTYLGDSADNVQFGYDESDNRVSMSNGAGSTTFAYDAANRLTSRQDIVGGHTFAVGYTYDGNDNVTEIDYASGRSVKYGYDAGNRITTVKDSQNHAYASAFTYHPSGAVAGFTSGNNVTQSFTFDRRYRPSTIASGPLNTTYAYDRVGNITSITDNTRPSFNSQFTVDSLDRLISVNGFGQSTYAYDAMGNRTYKANQVGGTSYGYDMATLRLMWSTGQEYGVYQYDPNGNTTSDGSGTFTYSPDDMLRTASVGGHTTAYAYDPDKLRVSKSTDGTTTYFVHGMSERLLSEFDASSSKPFGWIRDYIYAGDRLLAGASCQFSLGSTAATLSSSATTGSVPLTASTGCAWIASSDSAWAAIGSGTGTGSTAVSFSLSSNASGIPRTATLTIGGLSFVVTQLGASCSASLSPASVTAGNTGGSGSVGVTSPIGCAWSAAALDSWVTVTGGASGNGSGTVTYSFAANPASAPRSGRVTIGDQVFTVNQAGAACTFTVTPVFASFDANGGTGTIGVVSPGGCGWTASVNVGWLWLTGVSSTSGNGTVYYTVPPVGTGIVRTATVSIGGQNVTITQGAVDQTMRAADVDGDHRADLTVYNASTSYWYSLLSGSGFTTTTNTSDGGVGYVPVPGDFDGDGKADRAVYQSSTGLWYVLLSGSGYTTSLSISAGGPGWVPVPGDYDGDRKTDVVVYNTTTGEWYGLLSATNYSTTLHVAWGGTGYTAVPADYDGDGMIDLGVYQGTTGGWFVVLSSTNYTTSLTANAGGSGYLPVQADYDGDGKGDFVVYNTTTGLWYGLLSGTNYLTTLSVSWGGSGYTPVRGDYDGDGKTDLALYQTSTGLWSILLSGSNYSTTLSKSWGGPGYTAVPGYW